MNTAQNLAAEAAAPAAAPVTEKTMDVLFVLDGEIDMLTVPATFRGLDLRKQLAKQLSPGSKIKLFLLKHPDGSWPSQDDAAEAAGVEMRYVFPLRTIITTGELGLEDIVHFRVEVTRQTTDNVDEARCEGVSDLETSLIEYNSICEKSRKRKANAPKLAFSSFDSSDIKDLYKRVKRAKYTQAAQDLPPQYVEALKGEYERRLEACGEPWTQSESQRRIFINSVLVTCVVAANKACKESTDKLSLMTEHEIREDNINGTGKVDYVISRSDRMVVIIEAKKCDIGQGQEQNFAAMEAARLMNRKNNNTWHSIRGICTDFQNWVFIRRDSGILETDHESTRVTTEFSKDMLRIASKVYGMLLEL